MECRHRMRFDLVLPKLNSFFSTIYHDIEVMEREGTLHPKRKQTFGREQYKQFKQGYVSYFKNLNSRRNVNWTTVKNIKKLLTYITEKLSEVQGHEQEFT